MKKVDPVKMAKHDSIYTQDPEDGGYDYTSDHAFEAEQTVNVAGGQRGMKEKADQLRKLGRNEEAMILEQQLTSDQPFPSSLFKNPPPLGKGPLGGIKLQDLVRAMRLTRDYFRYIAPPKTSPPVGTNGMPMVWDGVAGLWRTAEEKPNMVWNSRKGAYEEDIPF